MKNRIIFAVALLIIVLIVVAIARNPKQEVVEEIDTNQEQVHVPDDRYIEMELKDYSVLAVAKDFVITERADFGGGSIWSFFDTSKSTNLGVVIFSTEDFETQESRDYEQTRDQMVESHFDVFYDVMTCDSVMIDEISFDCYDGIWNGPDKHYLFGQINDDYFAEIYYEGTPDALLEVIDSLNFDPTEEDMNSIELTI